MLITPRIQFDINDFLQIVGDGKHIMMRCTERLQKLSDDEAMTMRDALDALVKVRRQVAHVKAPAHAPGDGRQP